MAFVVPTTAAMTLTAIALIFDLRLRRIPNALTVLFFILGLSFHIVLAGWPGLRFSLLGFAAGFGPLFLLWLLGGGGGGDVKMMGALGAWLGGPVTILIFLGSAIAAIPCLLLTLAVARFRQRSKATPPNDVAPTEQDLRRRLLPYALPVTIVTWSLLVLKTANMIAALPGA